MRVHESKGRFISCSSRIRAIMKSLWLVKSRNSDWKTNMDVCLYVLFNSHFMISWIWCYIVIPHYFLSWHYRLRNHTTIKSLTWDSSLPSHIIWMQHELFSQGLRESWANLTVQYVVTCMIVRAWFITWSLVVESSHLHRVGGVGQ